MGMTIDIKDNSPEILKALENATNRALRACGERAVGYAQKDCPVDTGRLRASITYQVEGDDCYVGTNVEYGKYIEFGTGVYAESGGRQTPWAFEDSSGDWHMTDGAKPQPFLRPAASDHSDEYVSIMKDSLQNA